MKLQEINYLPDPKPVRSIAFLLAQTPNRNFLNQNMIYDCSSVSLDSLEGAPEIAPRDFYCVDNNLTSLEFAPRIVNGDFDCSDNLGLVSLKNIRKQIKTIKGHFFADNCWKLKNNLLGLILIDDLKGIVLDNKKIQHIMNKYFGQSNKKLAMLQCQQELIDAGFEEAAQL